MRDNKKTKWWHWAVCSLAIIAMLTAFVFVLHKTNASIAKKEEATIKAIQETQDECNPNIIKFVESDGWTHNDRKAVILGKVYETPDEEQKALSNLTANDILKAKRCFID